MSELTKLYIMSECLPKINGKTRRVDLSNYPRLEEIGASTKQLLPDDVPIWVDLAKACDVSQYRHEDDVWTVFFFEHGTEVRL